MTAKNNISTHPTGDAGATFRNPLASVDGRYPASLVTVVMSDFSAMPKPLTAYTATNLLSPTSNIRSISRKLCKRLRSTISPVARAWQRLVQSGFYEVARYDRARGPRLPHDLTEPSRFPFAANHILWCIGGRTMRPKKHKPRRLE